MLDLAIYPGRKPSHFGAATNSRRNQMTARPVCFEKTGQIHSVHSIRIHSIPFHSIPFHSIPSIPFVDPVLANRHVTSLRLQMAPKAVHGSWNGFLPRIRQWYLRSIFKSNRDDDQLKNGCSMILILRRTSGRMPGAGDNFCLGKSHQEKLAPGRGPVIKTAAPHCTKTYSGREIFAPDCLLVESGRKTNLNFLFYLYFYELFVYLRTCFEHLDLMYQEQLPQPDGRRFLQSFSQTLSVYSAGTALPKGIADGHTGNGRGGYWHQ